MNVADDKKTTNFKIMNFESFDKNFALIGAAMCGANGVFLSINPSDITLFFTIVTGVLTVIVGTPKAYLSIIKIIEISKRWKSGKLNELIDKELRQNE